MSTPATGLVLVVAAMVVESVAQLLLKVGASGGPRILVAPYGRLAGRFAFSRAPATWIACGALAYAAEILLYSLALQRLDVSLAFPLGSLCFVGVALLSRIFLGEAVGAVRGLGIGCILAGALLLTR